MRRYLAFYGDVYYPSGGMEDWVGDADTLEAAKDMLLTIHKERRRGDDWEMAWANVFDLVTTKTVYKRNAWTDETNESGCESA